MLQTFLNILSIIGIIAVASLVIIFLSDLFISIIDGTNGIFFKRNKKDRDDYNEEDDDRSVKRPVLLNEPKEYKKNEQSERSFERKEQITYDNNSEKYIEEEKSIDMEEARREEQLARQNAGYRQNMVDDRRKMQQNGSAIQEPIVTSTSSSASQKPIVTPAPIASQKPVVVQSSKNDEEDIDKLIAEISKQTLNEMEVKEDEERAKRAKEDADKQAEEMKKLKEATEQARLAQEEETNKLKAKQAEDLEKLKKEQAEKDEEAKAKQKELEDKQKALQDEIDKLKLKIETDKMTISDLETKIQHTTVIKPEVVKEIKTVEVVRGDKKDLENRLEVLKQRLKENEKELSANRKEYSPLRRVNMTLENDKKKLRRKEAIVAKEKVVLYGVNNYVDIDEEKAKKLSEELDLLEGLRLSVQHCEEVMQKNKDRYPILERANKFLVKNNNELKEDIKNLEDQIAKLEKDEKENQAIFDQVEQINNERDKKNKNIEEQIEIIDASDLKLKDDDEDED